MEEESPWGAPVSFPSPPRPPPRPLSPVSDSPSPSLSPRPSSPDPWRHQADVSQDAEGWGTTREEGRDDDAPEPRADVLIGDPWRRSSVPTVRQDESGPEPGPVDSDVDLRIPPQPSSTRAGGEIPPHLDHGDDNNGNDHDGDDTGHDDDDDYDNRSDRGWLPSTPPLPAIASPRRPSATATATEWEPRSFEDDPTVLDDDPNRARLPSVRDLFPSSSSEYETGERRRSVGDGEDAWGSADSWEVRQQRDDDAAVENNEVGNDETDLVTEDERREIERKVREAEEAAERGEDHWQSRTDGLAHASGSNTLPSMGVEPETTATASITTTTTSVATAPSLFRSFQKGIQATATKSNETLKNATSGYGADHIPKTGMSSIEDARASASAGAAAAGTRGHEGDEFDLDGPGQTTTTTKKSGWWGRSGGGDAHKAESGEQGDEANTVGAEQVEPGGSGKVEEPAQPGAPVGTIGRLFGRFKKVQQQQQPPRATGEGRGDSARSSQEQPRQNSTVAEPSWKDEDFDALGSGRFGAPPRTFPEEEVQDQEDSMTGGGFFGDRRPGRGSVKSRSRVPTAPPEDDFGGLLGAFSTAPTPAQTVKPKPTKPYDPFDPLSEPPPPAATARAVARPTSSLAAAPPPIVPSTVDDSFDAFFDSVTASIPKPQLSSIPTPPLSGGAPRAQASLVLPRSSTLTKNVQRPSSVSPVPRMTAASPAIRPGSSSTVSSRATTPILPLAPPPPPSQPLSQRNPPLLASLAVSRPGSVSPPPPPGPPRPPAAPARGDSGPLSRDDLSFFENL